MHINNELIYKRKILPIEATFLRSIGAFIAIAAQVLGHVDEENFKLAVHKLRKIYPILNCVVTWDENGESWFEEKETKPYIIIKERISENHFEKTIKEEWNKSFDLENGPLTRFILLKSDKKSEIIFMSHHCISDGIGITIIIESILKIMKGEDLNINTSQIKNLPSVKNFIKKRNFNIFAFFDEFSYKYVSYFLNYRWRRSKIYLPPEDIPLTHKIFYNYYEYCTLMDEFTEEETQSFINKCKEYKVTVTSAMTTAFLACRNELDKEHDNFKQLIPVDLRKYVDDDLTCAINCHSGSIDINFSYDTSLTFWENAKIYNKKNKDALNDFKHIKKVQAISNFTTDLVEASILSQRFQTYENLFKDTFSYSSKLGPKSNHVSAYIAKHLIKLNPSFCLTNMGSPNLLDYYGNLKLEKIFYYPSGVAHPPMTVLISVVTLNNRLFLSFHIAKKKNEDNGYEQITIKLKERYKEFLTRDIFLQKG